jgi:hypothetical protein
MPATPFFFSRFAFVDIDPTGHRTFPTINTPFRHNGP